MTDDKDEWGNIPLGNINDDELYTKKWNQSYALRGRKRPEHQQLMIENNPMKGKVHPNKGKEMPQISEKTKGKKKPDGFGELISKRRKELGLGNTMGGKKRPEHSERMKTNNPGLDKTRQPWTCEHCGKEGVGSSNYVRWHGDNCKSK